MKNISKIFFAFMLLISFSSLESCTYIKKADSGIRKAFGSVNRFQRQQKLYSRRLGLDEKNNSEKQGEGDENRMVRNPIQQKNMINDYGYLFEGINGYNPGVIVNYSNSDSTSNVFEIESEKFKSIQPNREVFGWHPYWMGNRWTNYPFELLSTISYFSYNVNPRTGLSSNPSQIEDWKTTAMIDSAKAKNTRVLLTVSLQGKTNQDQFLTNELLWNNLYQDVSKLILERNADGVDLNFEDLPFGLKSEFTDFVDGFDQYLTLQFQNNNRENPFISLTLPAHKDREHFDIKRLDAFIDLFIIMGYDYNGTSSPDAVSPLQSEGVFSLKNTVEYFKEKNINVNKTILALPYYGILWNINPSGEDDFKASIERKLTYSEIKNNFLDNEDVGSEVELDPISMSKIYRAVFEDNSIKEIHYDDAFTLSKKYDYAMNNNFQGVGIWALGYDNGNDELWNLIENYFSTDIAVFNDPISEVNGFPIKFAESLVVQKDVFIAIIIYFVLALVTAFVLILSDWRIRDSIIKNSINQLIVIFIGFILLIPLVVFVREILDKGGFFIKSSWEIYIGFFVGLLVFFVSSKLKWNNTLEKP
ncbi:glycosyl hydrolase family 18 protein [Flavobacteriaceae bacterium]|nr:glycosyl hydrolase family 18 protein [Flavobacteriaceae bacterium]